MLWLCGLLNHKYKRPSIESAKERPRPIRPEAKTSKVKQRHIKRGTEIKRKADLQRKANDI